MQTTWTTTPRQFELGLYRLALIGAPPVLAATTFQVPPSPSDYLGFAVPILVAQATVVLIALWFGMRPVQSLWRLRPSTRIATLIWLAAIASVSFLAAPYPQVAQIFLLVLLVHASFALALGDRLASRWENMGGSLLIAAGWGSIAFCILTYGLMFTVRDVANFDWVHIGVGVSNVRQFGYFGLTAFAIGVGLTVLPGTASGRFYALRNFAFTTVGSGMSFWSGGRAVTGALIVASAFAIYLAATSQRKRVMLTTALALALGAALSFLWLPSDLYGLPRILGATTQVEHGSSDYSSNRFTMWKETIALISEKPFLGYGMGQFKFIVRSAMNTYPQPHNSVIQLLFQWGLIGTAAFLVMIWPAIAKIGPAVRAPGSDGAVIAICLLSGHFAMSLLDGNLFHVYPVSIVVLALVVLASSPAARGVGRAAPATR